MLTEQLDTNRLRIVQTRSLLLQIVNTCFTGRLLFDENDKNVKWDIYSVGILQVKAIWIQEKVE